MTGGGNLSQNSSSSALGSGTRAKSMKILLWRRTEDGLVNSLDTTMQAHERLVYERLKARAGKARSRDLRCC